MVRIWNKRYGDAPVGAVYVGRPTKWGNPYKEGWQKDIVAEGEPHSMAYMSLEECLYQYEQHLKQQMARGLLDPTELAGKDLVCWCVPKGGAGPDDKLVCHAQVLAGYANRLEEQSDV